MKDNTTGIEKTDNIKFLFNEISKEKRNEFYKEVSKEFGVKISSVRVGWFNRFEIPEKYKVQENLIEFMQKFIANQ